MRVRADGAAEIAFCKQAFGAIELSRRLGKAGEVVHATLRIASVHLALRVSTLPITAVSGILV